MKEITIVDNYMDEREFRNYVNTMFYKHGYYPLHIDDVRIADDDRLNDNDLKVTKDKITYAVQTYLNIEITNKQIEETLKDMDEEKLNYGLIVSNLYVSDEIKEKAYHNNITILDRKEFENGIYN